MITLTADFSGVVEGLGAAEAYMSLDKNIPYYNAVVDYAFNKAEDSFNLMAAAYAEAGGEIKHMYEFGTLGVNRGQSNMRPRPTEERARLWKTLIINHGPKAGASVTYEYKPSFSTVPRPTTIAKEARDNMRPHIFKWKAAVLERGTPVTIALKQAQFLLIPIFPGDPYARPHDIKRGYTLTKLPFVFTPGRRTAGHFTAFWTKYWSAPAVEVMATELEKQFQEDFVPYFIGNPRRRNIPRNIIAGVKARSLEIQKEVALKAKARQTRDVR